MSARAQKRNNVLAGLFLVTGLVLAVFISFWVEEGFENLPFVDSKIEYIARFDIGEGVPGLKPGSAVTLGGKEIGSVDEIRYHTREVDGRPAPAAVDVVMRVESDLVIYEDADVVLVVPLLGTLSSINIEDIGGGAEVLAGGGVLDAGRPAGFADMEGVIAGAESALDRANEILDTVAPHVEPAAEDVRGTLTDTRAFAESLRRNQERWFDKTDSILDNADTAFGETFPAIAGEVRGGVVDARRLLATTQGVIDENRGDIRRAVDNIEGITTRVRFDVMGRIDRLLEEGVIAAANVGEIGDRALAAIDRFEPRVDRTLANLQLASTQGLLMVEEIRAAPWRALNPPSEKAQREEILFSAVRRYAQSVERLRDASASLESVVRGARAGAREIPAEQVESMTAEIRRSFQAYDEAEQNLLSLLARQTGQDSDDPESGG